MILAKKRLPIDSGQSNVLKFSIDEVGFRHGITIGIRLRSASGQEYPMSMTLSQLPSYGFIYSKADIF